VTGESRTAEQFVVCHASELPPGTRRIVRVGGKEIGVFNVDGNLFAVRNRCPHQGAPLCLGELTDLSVPRFDGDDPPSRELERHGEILRCPWHGWEFDLRSGEAIIREGWRVGTYRTFVSGGEADGAPYGEVPDAVETYRVSVAAGAVVVEVSP
jgi:3-phenylpropionate/trans-cinnamate dioxygenase ferredoxin subunit